MMIYLISFLSPFISIFNFIIQIMLVRYFGLSEILDIYFLSLSLPILFSQTIHAGFSYGIMPMLAEPDENTSKIYSNQIFLVFCIGVSLIFLIAILFVDIQLNFYSKFNGLNLDDFKIVFILAWFYGALTVVLAALGTIFIAEKKYFQGILLPFSPQLGLLILLLFGSQLSASWLLLSSIIGAIAGVIFSLKGIYIYLNSIFDLKLSFEIFKPYLIKILYAGIGSSIFGSYLFIDSLLAIQFGTGSLTALGYSQRIVIGFGNIAILGVFTVAIPELMESLRKRRWLGFRKKYLSLLKKALLFSLILAIFILLFINFFIEFFFISNNFSQSDADSLSNIVKYMLPGMVAMLATAINGKALYCLKDFKIISIFIGFAWPAIYSFFIFYFRDLSLISFGIAYSISWIIIFLVTFSYIFMKISVEINKDKQLKI